MKEQNNDSELRQLLRDKLEEHTAAVPDFVWPEIERELFPPAKKRRPFFWWFVFSGLLIGTLSFFFLFQSTGTGISSGMTAAAIRKTLQAPAHSDSTPEQQSLSTHQTTLTENKFSQTTASESSEYTTRDSGKTGHSSTGSNQPGTHSKSYGTKSVTGEESAVQLSNQNTPVTNGVKPAVATPARALLRVGSLMAKTTDSFATVAPTNGLKAHTDSASLLTVHDLSPKTLSFQPDTVRPILPPSERFAGFSFLDIYFGAGRNRRTYSGIVESNSNAFIIDRTLQLKNTNFGIDYNYQFLPFASARIGFNMGANRYITRLFPIRIANTDLNNELEISSLSGDLKSAPLELNDQASSISDTTTFLMRIVHRSRYFSVPLSVRFNTTNEKGPQLYGYTGFDFVFRGNDRNILIVRKSQFERSYSTSNPRGARGFYSGWHIGMGLASNNSRRFQFFSEFNYSQVIGNYYSGKVVSIKSANLQLNAGLRINL